MKEFFKVVSIEEVLTLTSEFESIENELVALNESHNRVIAEDISSDIDIPDFNRSTMDGYAVCATSTFGASESSPAYLEISGTVVMGQVPDFIVKPGESARISTGGMLPEGTDSVVMVEHTDLLDDNTIEVYRSVAPGQHVITRGEDFERNKVLLSPGRQIRPQESGLLAAMGKSKVRVYKRPLVGIISTGDEVVPVNHIPGPGQIRDVNTYSLSGQVRAAGGIPISYGIVKDQFEDLFDVYTQALECCDMLLISGGSSVGTRDFTIEVIEKLANSNILFHGISISPGKPTILANVGGKPVWGLPGHITSAMVVFTTVVRSFLYHIGGMQAPLANQRTIQAVLSRNLSSAQGRVDYVRVKLTKIGERLEAEPLLGKSGLIHTMVGADGLIAIDINSEGLDKGAIVSVIPF